MAGDRVEDDVAATVSLAAALSRLGGNLTMDETYDHLGEFSQLKPGGWSVGITGFTTESGKT